VNPPTLLDSQFPATPLSWHDPFFPNVDDRNIAAYARILVADVIQPGESLAAAGVAKSDRQLIVDKPAAAVDEKPVVGWSAGPPLLAVSAESRLTRRLFGSVVCRIVALPTSTG
jgi:hypothetical protein